MKRLKASDKSQQLYLLGYGVCGTEAGCTLRALQILNEADEVIFRWDKYTSRPFRNGLISMIVMVKPLRFLPSSLYVRLIVMQSSNGQSQDDRLLSPPGSQARSTAERLLRTRPKTYRAIVQLLVDPGATVMHIAKLHRVSEHTVRGIRAREGQVIAERKQRLNVRTPAGKSCARLFM